MSTAVDFHSHILPGIDDGSKNPEESVEMLKCMQTQGIDCVVATPHFYPLHDQLDQFLERREQAVAAFREKIGAISTPPELHIGAEVHFFRGIGDCDALPLLTIDGGNYIMIELPHGVWNDEIYRQIEHICTKQNLHPIIAHIDRYLGGFWTAKKLERLWELPVLIQANADAFTNKRTEKKVMRMLKDGRIHLLGSDCHNLTTRKPNLEKALRKIEKHLGTEVIARIHECEKAVLANEECISHTHV